MKALFSLLRHEGLKINQFIVSSAFVFLAVLGNGLLFLVSIVFYYLEQGINPNLHTFLDSLWWGISTITTVGYGDLVPVTTAGKILGIILMYSGTVLFISFTGLLAGFWMHQTVSRDITPIEKEVKKEEQAQRNLEASVKQLHQKLDILNRHLEKWNR